MAATTNGSLVMGVDWDSNNATPVTYDVVSNYTPVVDVPIWQSAQMPLPSARLQTRKEYLVKGDTKTPDVDLLAGYLMAITSGAPQTELGHIWIEYDVSLFGTISG